MIKIKESIINKVSLLKHGTLSVTLLIKPEDYTTEERLLLEKLWSDGTSLVGILQELWKEYNNSDEERLKKMRVRLAILMEEYSKVSWQDIKSLEYVIHYAYWVASRKELNEEQLKTEIDKYDAGIKALQLWLN